MLMMVIYIPTLTAVRLSSSEARLPPPVLLVILNLLVLLVWVLLAMALIGLWRIPPGDAGGELAMAAMGEL
jgi:hypothetical protein